MTQSYIDSATLQPARFGELYGDRDIKVFGEARFVSGSNAVQTQGVVLLVPPRDGGTTVINTVPNLSYTLAADGASLWARVNRNSGAYTLVNGVDLIVFAAGAQPKPQQDWVQLFSRHSGKIVALGGFVISNSTQYTQIGFTRSSDYDLVVGPAGNPNATHTNIQTAINDAVDGNRILILEGTYTLTSVGNAGVDASAGIAWTNKTLTIEGEGFKTVIINGGGGGTRTFGIQSGSATATAGQGNGSRILNLVISNYAQPFRLDANGFGIRHCHIDVWMINATSLTEPTVTGAGTSENNTVRLKIHNTGLTPNYHVRDYNLSSVASGSRVRTLTDQDSDAKLRIGSTNNIGRLKLPVYNTVNMTGATGLEVGELFYDTDRGTLEARTASSFNSFVSVPMGTIIAVGAVYGALNNGGAVSDTVGHASTYTFPANWKLCDGTVISTANSPFNTKFVPKIDDERFLQGNTASGPSSAITSPVNSGNVTDISHSHPHPHTHPGGLHQHPFPHKHTFPHTHNYPHMHDVIGPFGPAGSHLHEFPHYHQVGPFNHNHEWIKLLSPDGGGNYKQWNSFSPVFPSSDVVGAFSPFAGVNNYGISIIANRGTPNLAITGSLYTDKSLPTLLDTNGAAQGAFLNDDTQPAGDHTHSSGPGYADDAPGNPGNPSIPAPFRSVTNFVTGGNNTTYSGDIFPNAVPVPGPTPITPSPTLLTGPGAGTTGAESPVTTGPAGLTTLDRRPKFISVKYYMRIF